jgi:hypothetical protein
MQSGPIQLPCSFRVLFWWTAMQKKPSLLRRESTRKEYAVARLRLATSRLMRAESEAEKALAICWMNAWASVIGDARFPDLIHTATRPKAKRRSSPKRRD